MSLGESTAYTASGLDKAARGSSWPRRQLCPSPSYRSVNITGSPVLGSPMWSPHLVSRLATEKGISPARLESIRETLSKLNASGVAPILSLRHLSLLTGTSYRFLRHVISRSRKFEPYRHYSVSKRSGGKRLLSEPQPMLRQVQRWLVDNVLNKVKPHPASHAFAPSSSVIGCARIHCGAKWLVKLDVSDFFESISEVRVYHVFASLGYPNLVSFELSRLCTCTFPVHWQDSRYQSDTWHRSYSYGIPSYNDFRVGHLPQGAPSSPMLANLACRDLDAEIEEVCLALGWTYTRYADDICLSSLEGDRGKIGLLYHQITHLLQRHCLRINPEKFVVSPPGARKIVLGLLVDGDRPRLLKEYRSALEAHLYYALKFGLEDHAKKRGFMSALSLLQFLQGKVAFALEVEDKDASQWREQLVSIQNSFLKKA